MSDWQPIETAPSGIESFFWVVPKTANEAPCDTDGKPIVAVGPGRLHLGKPRTWSSLEKPTHWMPLPEPPQETKP